MVAEQNTPADFSSFYLTRRETGPAATPPAIPEDLRGLHLMRLSTWAGMFAFGITVWALVLWVPLKLAGWAHFGQ